MAKGNSYTTTDRRRWSKPDRGSCWNGNNYYLCQLCGNLVRARRWMGPWECCGHPLKEIPDKKAREIIESSKKRRPKKKKKARS